MCRLRLVRPTGRKGLGLIAGNKETSTAQIVLDARRDAISYVRDALKPLMRANGESPRYVVFDTAPSVGGLQERALWAADLVLIPSACDFLASDGVAQVVETMHMLAERFGWEGRLLGVLPTFFDSQTRQSQNTLDDLRRQFNGQLSRRSIGQPCCASARARRTIFEYDGRSRAASNTRCRTSIVEVTA
jgi:chromosome partitioning protein